MQNRKCWTAVVCLGLTSLMGGHRLWASPVVQKGDAELKAKMVAEGWAQVTDGVFERQLGPNKVERLGFGREGLTWTVGELTRKIESLQKEQEAYPSEKLAKIIDELKTRRFNARQELWKLDQSSPRGLSSIVAAVAGGSCSNICYSATADAYYHTSVQGVGAVAEAKFNSTCGYSGDTYAYAYARATLGSTTTTITQSDPKTGTNITSYASASANGGSVPGISCYSEASSYAQSSALGIHYSTSDTNSSCPAPSLPCTVNIIGTTYEYFSSPYDSCRNITFSASASNCTATSYQWKIGSTVVGTGSTYTRTICPYDWGFTLDLSINSGAATDSDGHDVYIDTNTCGGGNGGGWPPVDEQPCN